MYLPIPPKTMFISTLSDIHGTRFNDLEDSLPNEQANSQIILGSDNDDQIFSYGGQRYM